MNLELWHIRLLLFFRAGGTTFIPRLFPFLYAAIIWLILKWADPLMLSYVLTGGAVFGSSVMRVLDRYIDGWLKRNIRIPENPRTWIGKKTKWLHDKLHITPQRWVMFWLVTLTTWSPVPDILIVRYARKKMHFLAFLLATIIGKIFVYTPVIYGVSLIDLLF